MPMAVVELIGRVNLPSLSCNGVTASSASEQEIKCELLVTVIALQCLDAHVLRESHFHQLFHFSLYVFLLSIILHPLLCCELVQLPISFILSCDFSVLWIVWLGTAEKSLKRNECGTDGKCRRPLVLQDVQANSSGLRTNIWVPYFSVELHLWWLERIVWWNVDVHVKDASFVASVFLYNEWVISMSQIAFDNQKKHADQVLTGPNIFPFQCLKSSPTTLASTTCSPLAYININNDQFTANFSICSNAWMYVNWLHYLCKSIPKSDSTNKCSCHCPCTWLLAIVDFDCKIMVACIGNMIVTVADGTPWL